ncbi:MFS transporter [Blastococcus saxobsidens]|uniref:Putative MFS family arabinose efflux permease n=1 Tax=Blastococcus saxobsidens TaxID=138336 RepID=A0A4Q7YB12_9ACTN|nr:MFS transporter [Blastococcus saxobsidens]RZU33339.1 putative MFS family arabinose efflux permease [Blastococcus saxobsidens]
MSAVHDPQPDLARGQLRGLQGVNLASSLDRSTIAPMLLVIAADLRVSVAEVTVVASVYYLTYGLMQPVWGIVSARVGTVRTLRLTLAGAGIVGLVSALAPDVVTLTVLRSIAGGLFAAAIPSTLTYVGATVPVERRQQPLADLMAGVAVGMAAATLAAGWAAELISWRWAFAGTAAAGVVLALLLRTLPELPRVPGAAHPVRALLSAVREPWTALVLVLGFVEGAALTGVLTFIAPGVEESIAGGAGLAGTVVAAYGLSVLLFTRVVRLLSRRLTTPTLLVIGGVAGAAGFGVLVLQRGLVGGVAACFLLGAAWAFMHSTLQTWATSVAPAARAQVVSLFAACLFLGGATGAALSAGPAEDGRYALLFGTTAFVFVPLTLVAALARRRYLRTRPGR